MTTLLRGCVRLELVCTQIVRLAARRSQASEKLTCHSGPRPKAARASTIAPVVEGAGAPAFPFSFPQNGDWSAGRRRGLARPLWAALAIGPPARLAKARALFAKGAAPPGAPPPGGFVGPAAPCPPEPSSRRRPIWALRVIGL